MKVFAWRAYHKALPTIVQRHIVDLNLCPIYKSGAEDPLHVVLGYPEVERVWRDHIWFYQEISSPPADFTDLLSRFLQVTNDNRAKLFICKAWGLWHQWNTLRIGLPSLLLDMIGPQAAKLLQDFLNAQEDQSICNPMTPPNSWCPLSSLSFKANIDGAVFNNSHSASVGVVIRNRSGEVVAAMSERIPLPNLVLEVEAMACRRAVKFAFEVGVQEVIF